MASKERYCRIEPIRLFPGKQVDRVFSPIPLTVKNYTKVTSINQSTFKCTRNLENIELLFWANRSVTEQNVTKAKTKNRKSIVFHLPYLSSVLEVEMMN